MPSPSRTRVIRVAVGLLIAGAMARPIPLKGQEILAEPSTFSAEALEGRRVILVTGSTSGLGRALALDLGSRGAHVIVHGRSRPRGLEVVDEIRASGRGSASFYQADFASMDEVRRFAEAVLRDYARIDVLINNAGILASGEEGRQTSPDGYELSFAVNYLSGFLLTRALLPIIPETPSSRIVNVSSGAQTPIDFDDPMMERNYSAGRSYGQSKLAQILFTFDLARELEGTGIKVNTLHPATYMDTNMVLAAGIRPRSSVEEGKEAVLNLVDTPEIGSGQYFNGLRPARANAQAYDEEARARLRRLSEELTGLE